MDLGWVGLTQVESEEVRTSRLTPRNRSNWTTGGTSGSTSISLKLSYRLWQSYFESIMVKGGYSLSSRRTKNSQLKRQKSVEIHLSLTLMRVKLVPVNVIGDEENKVFFN